MCRDVVNVVEDLIARWRVPLNLYVRRAHCGAARVPFIKFVTFRFITIQSRGNAAVTKDAAPRADERWKSAGSFLSSCVSLRDEINATRLCELLVSSRVCTERRLTRRVPCVLCLPYGSAQIPRQAKREISVRPRSENLANFQIYIKYCQYFKLFILLF